MIYSTGYYAVNDATGVLTGIIDTYQGTRTFTGLWNMITGNFYTGYVDYRENNYINGDKYENLVGGSNYALNPTLFDVTLIYTDVFNTNNGNDVAKLTISGYGLESGIIRYLTGLNPQGLV